MNVAKWVLCAMLTLPLLEQATLIAVAAVIGFGWALGLVLAGSLAGLLILRRAGGNHIARIRVALDQGSFAALQTESSGGQILLAGILLLIPGFITDLTALFLHVTLLRRAASAAFGRPMTNVRKDGVVDLAPEQWHQSKGRVFLSHAPLNARVRFGAGQAVGDRAPALHPAGGRFFEKSHAAQNDTVLVRSGTLC